MQEVPQYEPDARPPRPPRSIRHRVRSRARRSRAASSTRRPSCLLGLGLAGVSAVGQPTAARRTTPDGRDVAADQQARARAPPTGPTAPSARPPPPRRPQRRRRPRRAKAARDQGGHDPQGAHDRRPPRPPKARSPAGLGQPDAGRRDHLLLRPALGRAARRHRPRRPAGTPIHAVGAGTVVARRLGLHRVRHLGGHRPRQRLPHPLRAPVQGRAVSVGQQGQAPARSSAYEGSTGDSTGPHLHFEVHQGLWNQIDPAPWLRARGVDVGC